MKLPSYIKAVSRQVSFRSTAIPCSIQETPRRTTSFLEFPTDRARILRENPRLAAIHLLQDDPDVGARHAVENVHATGGFHRLPDGVAGYLVDDAGDAHPHRVPVAHDALERLLGFLDRKAERTDFRVEFRQLIG